MRLKAAASTNTYVYTGKKNSRWRLTLMVQIKITVHTSDLTTLRSLDHELLFGYIELTEQT